jgi:RsiW-degrading membrane proteinase PrsW (M82 family)
MSIVTIQIPCPICRRMFKVGSAAAGRRVRCPNCQQVVTVAMGAESPVRTKESRLPPEHEPSLNSAGVSFKPANSVPAPPDGRPLKTIFDDLRSLNLQSELLPLSSGSMANMLASFRFWSICLLGVVPLLIGTLQQQQLQLTAFAIFFACVWGVIFKSFVVPHPGSWRALLASMFFTGIIGITGLLFVYGNVLPRQYLALVESQSIVLTLLGFVLQVGLCEELTKSLPVLWVAWRYGARINPRLLILIGVFSGLGFAAFENIGYGEHSVVASFNMTRDFGAAGLVAGIQGAMSNVLLRSLSLVFCHGVWSGIVAYFLAMATVTNRRKPTLFLVGVTTAAVLHGLYDWLFGIQSTFAVAVVLISFVLFFAYICKLTDLLKAAEPVAEVEFAAQN